LRPYLTEIGVRGLNVDYCSDSEQITRVPADIKPEQLCIMAGRYGFINMSTGVSR
jgi:hypothetical protein